MTRERHEKGRGAMLVNKKYLKRLARDEGFVINAANWVDSKLPSNSFFENRRRWCHPFGARARRANNVSRVLIILAGASAGIGVIISWGSTGMWLAVLILLASLSYAVAGLSVDAPTIATEVMQVVSHSWYYLALLVLALACAYLAIFFLPGAGSEQRLMCLGAMLFMAVAAKTLFLGACSGSSRRRRFRRHIAIQLSRAIWVLGALVMIRLIGQAFPSQPNDTGEFMRWVLGLILTLAGYVVLIGRRRQKLYSQLLDSVDAVLTVLQSPGSSRSVEIEGCAQRLDRLLNCGVTSGSPLFGVRFESYGIRCALAASLQRGLRLEAFPLRLREPAVMAEVNVLSRTKCRQNAREYLETLRTELVNVEDPMATA